MWVLTLCGLNPLNGSSLEALGGNCFRGSGHADARALTIVRRPIRYFFSIARPDIPARASRRIAAYRSIFEGGMGTLSRHEAHPACHHKTPRAVKTREQRLHRNRAAVTPGEQLRSTLRSRTNRLNLWVFPIVLGVGKKVFDGGAVPANLVLLEPPVVSSKDAVLLRYGLDAGTPGVGDMRREDRGVDPS